METDSKANGPRVWLILHKAQKALQASSEADIREQGWCMSDFAVLELLLHKGTLPVTTIGKRILLTSGSISVAIDRLEAKGLVVRVKSPDDRRVTLVALTPKGHETISRVYVKHQAALDEAVANLDADECTELIRLLKKLGGVAQKAD